MPLVWFHFIRYITSDEADSRILFYTSGEELSFVEDFITPQQWKRREYDAYNPYLAQDRYRHSEGMDDVDSLFPIIPTPHSYKLQVCIFCI